jgi:hypothetical protein
MALRRVPGIFCESNQVNWGLIPNRTPTSATNCGQAACYSHLGIFEFVLISRNRSRINVGNDLPPWMCLRARTGRRGVLSRISLPPTLWFQHIAE